MMPNKKTRPVFRYKNNVYVSAGVIPYIVDSKGTFHYLLQKRKDKDYYEDMGGKSENGDKDITDIARREILEELNFLAPQEYRPPQHKLTEEIIESSIKKCAKMYLPDGKYVVFFIKIPGRKTFNTDIYRSYEYDKDGVPFLERTFHWVSETKIKYVSLHPRLWKARAILKAPGCIEA